MKKKTSTKKTIRQDKYALIMAIAIVLLLTGIYLCYSGKKSAKPMAYQDSRSATYNPVINPQDFVTQIDNQYLTLKPGTKFVFKSKSTKDGVERAEVEVTNKTRVLMGVTTTVVHDRVWLNNQIKEDTYDMFAQDKEGTVWYFGESVDNYSNGRLRGHESSWLAGVDGAFPGVIMPAHPVVGNTFRQEYYAGQAEDIGDIVALDQQITVPYGTFNHCVQLREWSKIEQGQGEYKYYCSEVGFLVSAEQVNSDGDKEQLVSIVKP